MLRGSYEAKLRAAEERAASAQRDHDAELEAREVKAKELQARILELEMRLERRERQLGESKE